MLISSTTMRCILAAICLTISFAQAGEIKLTGDEITAALSDKTLAGSDGSKQWTQLFQEGGLTVYTVDGSSSDGRWAVRGDQYCSQWPPSDSWACYDVTADGKTIIFISSMGNRYPALVAE